LLQSVADDEGEYLNTYMPHLIKFLQKLVKEHISLPKEPEDPLMDETTGNFSFYNYAQKTAIEERQ
jgi:hypothetical protein